jgi:ubiquinone/menaquinone biosynthesis C-methylase UbiE
VTKTLEPAPHETVKLDPPHLYKAYDRINKDFAARTQALEAKFDTLLALSKELESPLLREMKVSIVVALKWKFDYLARTFESPFELEGDLDYWIRTLSIIKELGEDKWFEMTKDKTQGLDVWKRTAQGFDTGWTTTTEGMKFAASQKIAKDRTDQFVAMMGGPEFIKGKKILDAGCGPGRYIDLLRRMEPAKIVGMDQGQKLVDVLKKRFAGDDKVEIVKGSVEKLDFAKDEEFDIVLSNGVIHHTPHDLETMFKDHARVLKPGGAMFIMLVGQGGLELKIWEFLRGFLYDIPIEAMLERVGPLVSPLRLQGIVDHMYGEYQQTSREQFEGWCKGVFKKVERVAGIQGLDITPEIYEHDPFCEARWGTGHMRYLLWK